MVKMDAPAVPSDIQKAFENIKKGIEEISKTLDSDEVKRGLTQVAGKIANTFDEYSKHVSLQVA